MPFLASVAAVGGACVLAGTYALPCNQQTSLTLLYNNNLNFTDDVNHIGAILLDPSAGPGAKDACTGIGESLLTKQALDAHAADFISLLSYEAYAGRQKPDQQYLIANGTVRVSAGQGNASLQYDGAGHAAGHGPPAALPVLCTQSSNQNQPANAQVTSTNQVTVSSNANTFTGFRNQKSFRFLGIPYANPVERFHHSTVSNVTGKAYNATQYGPFCAQGGTPTSVEDCLFLNIQTPYIPKAAGPGAKKPANLRPVHFFIHGGGFTTGASSYSVFDGGQIASREDIVVVTPNYRLSTLGFLAVPGTPIKGNYGIGDQITALRWVRANIAAFGGDPDRITINGGSAGAGSVRTHLGSPQSIGLFHGAIAQSNLGGGVTLGLAGDYGTTYSSYLTINQSYALAGQQIFSGVGCNQTSVNDQVDCLRKVDAQAIVNLPTVARYVVQDGTIVNTPNLDVARRAPGGKVANVNTIWGVVKNDGASFCTLPKTAPATENEALRVGLGITESYAQQIIDSGLFPLVNVTGNFTIDTFNVTARVAHDKIFRCIDQATIYAGVEKSTFKDSYFYQLERGAGGYNPNAVDSVGPVTPGYPNGNPNLPYFRLHGGDAAWTFGNLQPLRDADDLLSTQLTTDYFGAFVRTLDPNPEPDFLAARRYQSVIDAAKASGPWEKVRDARGPIKLLDATSTTAPFQDLEQCAFLNYSVSYYLDGRAT